MTYLVVMDFPTTLGGWVAAASGVVVIVSLIGGLLIRTSRGHVDSAVERKVHTEVPAAVALALREVNAKLDGIRINQAELSAEVGRVRILETKIDNGLASRTANIETRQSELIEQVAEMHGWMEATHRWDGADRRA